MARDLGLLVLRLIVGPTFAAHGYPKLFGGPGKPVPATAQRYLGQGFVQAMERGGPGNFSPMLTQLSVPAPSLMAWVVGLVEFGGGLALAVGWKARLASLLLAINMAVATWKVHWKNGLIGSGSFEFSLVMLAACLALLGIGPGKLSLDRR